MKCTEDERYSNHHCRREFTCDVTLLFYQYMVRAQNYEQSNANHTLVINTQSHILKQRSDDRTLGSRSGTTAVGGSWGQDPPQCQPVALVVIMCGGGPTATQTPNFWPLPRQKFLAPSRVRIMEATTFRQKSGGRRKKGWGQLVNYTSWGWHFLFLFWFLHCF